VELLDIRMSLIEGHFSLRDALNELLAILEKMGVQTVNSQNPHSSILQIKPIILIIIFHWVKTVVSVSSTRCGENVC
jgi:hypothetical protein